MSIKPNWPCPDNCMTWCRDGSGPMTNHHPHCQYVGESLIDVWLVSLPGENGGCIVDSEESAKIYAANESEDDEPLVITKKKMHREIYENLPEFAGF